MVVLIGRLPRCWTTRWIGLPGLSLILDLVLVVLFVVVVLALVILGLLGLVSLVGTALGLGLLLPRLGASIVQPLWPPAGCCHGF